jgi:steroid delta-isomerase-like uncharacterized protein
MDDHGNVSVARDMIEAFNEADYERCGALLAPDALYIETSTARRVEGRDAILEVFEGWRTAFPDARGTIVSAVTSDDTVALQLTWEGTQTGPLHSPAGVVPPSGQSTTTPAAMGSEASPSLTTCARPPRSTPSLPPLATREPP